MDTKKRNIFIAVLVLILISSIIPNTKGFSTSEGLFFNGVPLLLNIALIAMVFFQTRWISLVVIIWSIWQILTTAFLLFGIGFVMISSGSAKFPFNWVVLQSIFGILKLIGIGFLLYILIHIKTKKSEATS